MRHYRWMWGLAGVAVLALTAGMQLGEESPVAHAETKPSKVVHAPPVVLLSSVPGDTRTEVLEVSESKGTSSRVGVVEHVPEAVVRGAVLPTGGVAVVADTVGARELSWAATLHVVEKGLPARPLADRVYHASRPLVTSTGRLFVQRGTAASAPPPAHGAAQLRVDDLTIDEVDPASGATRSLLAWSGYETHLAGALDNELIVYRVGPHGADLIAVHMDTGAVRVIVPAWPPMARDFSIDERGRSLIVQQLDAGPPRQWVVQRVDLATGQCRSIASSPHRDLVPYAWPDGGVLFNPPDRRGPRVVASTATVGKLDGPGVMWLRTTSPSGAWVAGSWSVPGALPVGVVVRVSDGAVVRIPASEGHRVDVLGVVGGAS